MKKMKKITVTVLLTVFVAIAAFAVTACSCSGGNSPEETPIVESYTSAVRYSYANSRPGYNYYTFTSTFENITTYEDNTYCLIVSSTTHSGIVLSADDITEDDEEDFTGAKSNPRDTSVKYFYGTYEASGEGASKSLKLSMPFRIAAVYAGNEGSGVYAVDTAAWTDDMNKALKIKAPSQAGDGGYMIPEEEHNRMGYVVRNTFKETTVEVDATTGLMKSVVGVVSGSYSGTTAIIEESQAPDMPKLSKTAASPAYTQISDMYIGTIPGIDYASGKTTFKHQTVILYENKSYMYSLTDLVIDGLKLHNTDGKRQDYDMGEQKVTIANYYGQYTSKPNDFDVDTLEVTYKAPGRIVKSTRTDATASTVEYKDTLAMEKSDADNYIGANAFKEQTILVTIPSKGYKYVDLFAKK